MSYLVQLYSLHSTESQDFRVERATTLFSALRDVVAEIYGRPGETAQSLFSRCFFVLASLTRPNKVKRGEPETMRHTVLDEAQLYMNDEALAARQLLAKHVPKNHKLLVFPSPAHLIRATLRPPLRTHRESHFTVEIYAPHRHADLRESYEEAREQEAKYTRDSDGKLKPRRFVDRLKMPGRGVHDRHMDVTFIALDRAGVMIGYCETTLLLYPYGREEDLALADKAFLQGVAPGNLFEIVGLSALPSQGGHQIALVLLYHAFHFAWQHRDLLPCSHVCAHSASIVTKIYLTRQFGFAYYGGNAFHNDDFPDTVPPQLRALICDTLRTCCMYLRDLMLRFGGELRLHEATCIKLYQLTLWFRFINSKALELLLVVYASQSEPSGTRAAQLRHLIERHLALQTQPEGLSEWLRDDRFYKPGGLKHVQYAPLSAPEHEEKVPAAFGLDEVLSVVRAALEPKYFPMPKLELKPVLTNQYAQLRAAVVADAELDHNYVLPWPQLDAIASLPFYPTEEANKLRRQSARLTVYGELQTELFVNLYAVEFLDTHLVFARLGETMQRVGELYAEGETKNFITAQLQQEKTETTTKYPDDPVQLRALLERQAARIESSQQFDEQDDEYYHNLRLRLAFLSGELGDYVATGPKARSDQ